MRTCDRNSACWSSIPYPMHDISIHLDIGHWRERRITGFLLGLSLLCNGTRRRDLCHDYVDKDESVINLSMYSLVILQMSGRGNAASKTRYRALRMFRWNFTDTHISHPFITMNMPKILRNRIDRVSSMLWKKEIDDERWFWFQVVNWSMMSNIWNGS